MITISKNIISSFILVYMLSVQTAFGAMLTIDMNASNITVGNLVSFDVNISGLGNGVAPSISTYDLDFLFDTGILQYQSTVFGDSTLGNQLDLFNLGSIQSVQESIGTINLFELSLDTTADLIDIQADSFTLFSINFDAISIGTSGVSTAINSLGDQSGDPLTASTSKLNFTVNPSITKVVPVPTLTTWGLLLLSSLMLLYSRGFIKSINQ